MNLQDLHLHWGESSYRGKKYRSYSLARAFREDGRNKREIVVKLGKLSDDDFERWKLLLQAAKRPGATITALEDVVCQAHFDFLDVAALSAIWDDWRLDDVFPGKGKRLVDVAAVARALTINRSLDPTAKSNVPRWFQRSALPAILKVKTDHLNPSRIFRDLEVIEDARDQIQSHIYARLKRDDPRSLDRIFYDLSSTVFHGVRCTLVKWGRAKEGYENHVVIALVVNGDGLPFFWEVLPGGTSDAKTIEWLLKELKSRFDVGSTTLIFDRGMVSDRNLSLLEADRVKYISALDKNQIEDTAGLNFRALSDWTIDDVQEKVAAHPRFMKIDDVTFYRDVDRSDDGRRYILGFNVELFKEQRRIRGRQITDLEESVASLNKSLRAATYTRSEQSTLKKFTDLLEKASLGGFVSVELEKKYLRRKNEAGDGVSVHSYEGVVKIDGDKKKHAGRLDGFWVLVTNHVEIVGGDYRLKSPEVIKSYRDKHVIESSFRDIKSFVELAPVHVWTEKHVKAHYTVCVLSHLLNRVIDLRLKASAGNASKDVISHAAALDELSRVKIDRLTVSGGTAACYKATPRSAIQNDILARLHVTPPEVDKLNPAAYLS